MSLFGDAPAELLYNMSGVGGGVTGTVTTGTAALMSGGGGGSGSLVAPCEIPHNYFSKVGKAIMVDGVGVYSLGSVVPTIKIAAFIDNVVGTPTATALATTGAFTADTTSRAAMAFNFRIWATATAIGVNGALQAWGWLNWGMVPSLTTTVAAPQVSYYMGAGTTTPFSFNTTQSAPTYLEMFASWSTSSTGPSITLTQMFVWGLN